VDWTHVTQNSVQLCAREHGKEPSGFIKSWQFLDYICDYHLFNDTASWTYIIQTMLATLFTRCLLLLCAVYMYSVTAAFSADLCNLDALMAFQSFE
jgi:hypothetical protein